MSTNSIWLEVGGARLTESTSNGTIEVQLVAEKSDAGAVWMTVKGSVVEAFNGTTTLLQMLFDSLDRRRLVYAQIRARNDKLKIGAIRFQSAQASGR